MSILGGAGNPVFNDSTFENVLQTDAPRAKVMSVQGTINKAMILLALVIGAAYFTWQMAWEQISASSSAGQIDLSGVYIWVFGGAIAGFILALITIFVQRAAPITGPLYAVAQGLFLGAISAVFEANYPGIVVNAVGATFGTLLAMLLIYKSGLIKVNRKFIFCVTAGVFCIMLFYGGAYLMMLFGYSGGVNLLWGSGWLGIGISVVVIIVASLSLMIDFHRIETGAKSNAPRYMEWYSAFALMVTLIWLYLEFLRLFAKLQRR